VAADAEGATYEVRTSEMLAASGNPGSLGVYATRRIEQG